jgi:GDP-mannose 6-dehydrogenase
MRVCVFGLGYVGAVTAACLAEDGHSVIGVDVTPAKVNQINAGVAPIVEEGIRELTSSNVQRGRLVATTDSAFALKGSDLAIICVGTPSRDDGSLDLSFVDAVAREIGGILQEQGGSPLLVFRSTMLPGAMAGTVIPALLASGLAASRCRVVFHPEFLREGSSVRDFYAPPKIVVGEGRAGDSDSLLALYGEKYQCPRIVCSIPEAEMVKYCDNLFHALKVTFANEVGMFCHGLGIDSQRVMSIFCQDTKLNISHRYLKPGFAFGGSCLPKDLRAILSAARQRAIELPMLQGMMTSNRHQIDRAASMVLAAKVQRVGLYGLAFKEGTDDLRESPYVELAERLLGKGARLVIFDRHVQVARLIGKNRSYVERVLPHLVDMVTDDPGKLAGCELIVTCHRPPDGLRDEWVQSGIRVFDLTGAESASSRPHTRCVV